MDLPLAVLLLATFLRVGEDAFGWILGGARQTND
jgi:hypothetical protein